MGPYTIETLPAFDEWFESLADPLGKRRIGARIERLSRGNAGDHRQLHAGVAELRIDCGPGYRVYFTRHGERICLLLAGGDKSTQGRDIARAMELAKQLGGRP
jgi:putative addiction module killer protein